MQQETLRPLEERLPYEAPFVEVIDLRTGISILEIVSLEGEIYDFEDGDDF